MHERGGRMCLKAVWTLSALCLETTMSRKHCCLWWENTASFLSHRGQEIRVALTTLCGHRTRFIFSLSVYLVDSCTDAVSGNDGGCRWWKVIAAWKADSFYMKPWQPSEMSSGFSASNQHAVILAHQQNKATFYWSGFTAPKLLAVTGWVCSRWMLVTGTFIFPGHWPFWLWVWRGHCLWSW